MTQHEKQPEKNGVKIDCDVYRQEFSVKFEHPVHFTRGLFSRENPLFADVINRLGEGKRHRVLVYIDSGVADKHPGLIGDIRGYFHDRPETLELVGTPEIIPGGEEAKNDWEVVRDIMTNIGNHHLCRHSYIVGIGGGSVLDAVGFAASLVHRGMRMVRVPTTVLAQNDAGVGVKTGMNEHGMKNFLGSFAPPFAVINDFNFLSTLDDTNWRSGIAEAFKVAIIKDSEFFDWLCRNAAALRKRDGNAMEILVRRTAILHLDHIRTSGDAFEFGSARPLDFGHWSAHKLEGMSGYSIGHGQAVSIGIALDSFYAMKQNLITESDLKRILNSLLESGLPIWSDLIEEKTPEGELKILDGLDQFREHLGGVLTVTLPDKIGEKIEVHHMNVDIIEEGVRNLKKLNMGTIDHEDTI
ncbi:MAG: 3-dehydroquinate synthase [Planctomycetota bacterium]|nr:MAG: 3-dehydroquinate synthase [Planctomycetota bacterium]